MGHLSTIHVRNYLLLSKLFPLDDDQSKYLMIRMIHRIGHFVVDDWKKTENFLIAGTLLLPTTLLFTTHQKKENRLR